jgi:hypothetical protein
MQAASLVAAGDSHLLDRRWLTQQTGGFSVARSALARKPSVTTTLQHSGLQRPSFGFGQHVSQFHASTTALAAQLDPKLGIRGELEPGENPTMPTLSELQLGALQARAQELARNASPAAHAAHPPILRFSLEPLSALKGDDSQRIQGRCSTPGALHPAQSCQ